MEIIDLNRCPIQVTDLADAIARAEEMISFCPICKAKTEYEKRQLAYWQDLHEKLLQLQQKQHKKGVKA